MSSSRRTAIVASIVDVLNTNLDGNNPAYMTNMYGNVSPLQVYYEDINDYPYISIVPGPETRSYSPNMKWGFLTVYIRIFVEGEDAQNQLEDILSDVEGVLDSNEDLPYTFNTSLGPDTDTVVKIDILNIDTDQGLFAPKGMAEMILQVQYQVPRI